MANYDLARAVADLSLLEIGKSYVYASVDGHSNGSCALKAIDQTTGAIKFQRHGSSKVENVSANMIQKLVVALASRKAVEINSLYGGSGNFRSALEALFANTPQIYVCRVDGKKCIFWDEAKLHPVGEIVVASAPGGGVYGVTTVPKVGQVDTLGLKIGMRSEYSPQGVVTILDDDVYSYQVLCECDAKAAKGIRTIAKGIVREWIQALSADMTLTADDIRAALSGKSDIDKFEYGNAAPIHRMARMVLGTLPYTIVDVSPYWNRRTGRLPVTDGHPCDSLLDFAVRLFAERRLDDDWVKLLKRDGYEGLHARYAAMSADALANMTAAEFDAWVDKELWAASVFFCGDNLKKLSEADKKAVCSFISVAKKRPQLISSYFGKDAEHVNGVGPVIITELLMKFHPLDYMSYNLLMLQGLKVLGLVASDKMPGKVTPLEYQRVMGPAGVILGKLTDANVPRRFDEDASAAPDFVTVNEFLWWCKVHREDILKGHWEKNMKTEIKRVPQTKIDDFKNFIDKLETDVASVGLKYAPDLMKRFVCAQLAKPFVVLTGLSGSGKTKLAQAFTRWIGVENTYKVVPVGADWTNSEKLLGYPNALDPDKYVLPDTGVLKLMIDASQEENKDIPFFLILDEMNLSHVERYFADFLSAMESRETIKLYDGKLRTADDGTPIPQTLEIPDNLFVIGTMNVDETTYMFSPKVLDRAQVIEFRVSPKEMSEFLSAPANPDMRALNEKGAEFATAFLELAKKRTEKKLESDEEKLLHAVLVGTVPAGKDKPDGMFSALADLGAEFGYRSAIEIVTFVAYYLEASGYKDLTGTPQKECLNKAIDAAVLQKLLPKLHGSLNRLGPVHDALIVKVSKVKPQDNDPDAEPEVEKLYPLSHEKLTRMKDRVEKNGFTSFAEA